MHIVPRRAPWGGSARYGGPRRYTTPHTSTPRVQLLSNGRYSLMLTNAGGGYSLWNDMAVTRWRSDATRDCWGNFFYLRDLRTREVWSAAYQPLCGRRRDYEAYFAEDKVEFRRRISGIVRAPAETTSMICCSRCNRCAMYSSISATASSRVGPCAG